MNQRIAVTKPMISNLKVQKRGRAGMMMGRKALDPGSMPQLGGEGRTRMSQTWNMDQDSTHFLIWRRTQLKISIKILTLIMFW